MLLWKFALISINFRFEIGWEFTSMPTMEVVILMKLTTWSLISQWSKSNINATAVHSTDTAEKECNILVIVSDWYCCCCCCTVLILWVIRRSESQLQCSRCSSETAFAIFGIPIQLVRWNGDNCMRFPYKTKISPPQIIFAMIKSIYNLRLHI